jgi:hypothetical protein
MRYFELFFGLVLLAGLILLNSWVVKPVPGQTASPTPTVGSATVEADEPAVQSQPSGSNNSILVLAALGVGVTLFFSLSGLALGIWVSRRNGPRPH